MDKQTFAKLSNEAESGDTNALFEIGKMYFTGRYFKDLYIPQDKVKGYKFLIKAFTQGCKDAKSYLEQHCNKCSSCRGKGSVRQFFFLKRTCSQCGGSGYQYPDHAFHLEDKTEAVGFQLGVSSVKSGYKAPVCPVCRGTGKAKIYGIMGPCPACKPREHGIWKNTQLPPPPNHPWWNK